LISIFGPCLQYNNLKKEREQILLDLKRKAENEELLRKEEEDRKLEEENLAREMGEADKAKGDTLNGDLDATSSNKSVNQGGDGQKAHRHRKSEKEKLGKSIVKGNVIKKTKKQPRGRNKS